MVYSVLLKSDFWMKLRTLQDQDTIYLKLEVEEAKKATCSKVTPIEDLLKIR